MRGTRSTTATEIESAAKAARKKACDVRDKVRRKAGYGSLQTFAPASVIN